MVTGSGPPGASAAEGYPDQPGVGYPQEPAENYGPADDQFLDDLSAANRFKSFLIGTGVEVPEEVSKGIARLVSTFSEDLEQFEKGSGNLEKVAKASEESETRLPVEIAAANSPGRSSLSSS